MKEAKWKSDGELSDIQEVARLKRLLKSKSDEYKIFGITTYDIEKDNEIRKKIQVLEQSLKLI